jgi:hypothetical protein
VQLRRFVVACAGVVGAFDELVAYLSSFHHPGI